MSRSGVTVRGTEERHGNLTSTWHTWKLLARSRVHCANCMSATVPHVSRRLRIGSKALADHVTDMYLRRAPRAASPTQPRWALTCYTWIPCTSPSSWCHSGPLELGETQTWDYETRRVRRPLLHSQGHSGTFWNPCHKSKCGSS